MGTEALCMGDCVGLFSEESFGYVYSKQTSCIKSEMAVYKNQKKEHPEVPDPQVITFQLCVASRYKLNKKYRKIKEKSDADPGDIGLRNKLAQASVAADAENEDNVAEQRRQLGKKVVYGQVVQLQHLFTRKFIHVSTTQTSRTESSNMQVDLLDYNAKHCLFRVMPRYKVKSEGDVVQVGDQIVFESLKSQGQYMHVGKTAFSTASVYAGDYELNLSVRQSGFTIYRRYKPEKQHENMVKAGEPIRLFHKEIEANLVAEGLFDDEVTEDVHLRVRTVDQGNPKSLFPSTSAITYWQIELQDASVDGGGVVKWEQQCHFKHMCTRKYLKVEGSRVSLTDDHMDPKTVFKLHPVIKEKEYIEYETYCRVEQVVSGQWLHAEEDNYERTQYKTQNKNDTSMAGLQWTRAPLKQLSVLKEMQYDDAFTLQKVEDDDLQNFNFMAGMVPAIQKVLSVKQAGQKLNTKMTMDLIAMLDEIKSVLVVGGVPHKNRQKLIRNLRIVELLVKLLQLPVRGSPDQHHLTRIMVQCYDTLYMYLTGNSRKNELYMAKHIDFFESQIGHEGDIGLNAAHMVMELVKDNRKIVDRITHEHIDHFVDLLQRNKNYRYLDLLSVLCVCDGVSIPDNQTYITQAWLTKGQKNHSWPQNCVYHTELGEAIQKEANVVYVSKDNRKRWIPLHDFMQNLLNKAQSATKTRDSGQKTDRKNNSFKAFRELQNDEEFLFLDHQLDLFGKLCYGRNEYAIKVITEDLCYLTWKEAFNCLTNSSLPDQLRAKYCHLIIALFVDVGENSSVLDRINLTFVYDDIGADAKATGKEDMDAAAREKSMTKKYFPSLRDWISRFLDQNKDMTASEIGHNMLVEQVLRLVHYLAKFGYYGDLKDIDQLMGPLLSLLDGRNDKPYPHKNGFKVDEDVLKHYRKVTRYKEGPETRAVVDAKHQAMEVLDLFFNYRFNIRLESFVNEFKKTYTEANHRPDKTPELGKLLYTDYDIYDNEHLNHHSIKRLKEIFDESSFFVSFPIMEVLMDLSHYEYDIMVVKSMTLLNRYYSAYDNLFKRAVQAQVVITDGSAKVLVELREMLPIMQRLTSAKMSQEQTKKMGEILDRMALYCCLENEPEETHPMNQNILYNHGVLATIFDILSQEIDIRLLEQYSGIRGTFQKAFTLLRVMAKGNETVQQRLFDRLDMLLSVQGAEPEMAEALTEVFTGNKTTCLKVLSGQVQRIMQLAAVNRNGAPQFLDLLNALVKVEELNLPLKRNQGYVMKYFMQLRDKVAYVIDQPPDKRRQLLGGGPSPDLDYMIALVDLLATCAEGENRFIESICQTIFSIQELLEILNDSRISNNLKRPYVRFLLWVYLNTASGMIDSGAGDMPHDPNMWNYINSLNEEMSTLIKYAQQSTETVKQLLKKPPGKCTNIAASVMDNPDALNTILSEQGRGDWKAHHGSLHYILDAVMPFLQIFFRSFYQPDSENFRHEADHVDKLAKSLVEFSSVVGPLISNPTHMKNMVGCINVALSSSTLLVQVMEEFQNKYGGTNNVQDVRSDARKRYEEYYQQEEELNGQLNVFAINYSAAYGGFNDVKTQIGFNSDLDYTEIEGDEELPLGEEFQQHLKCFIKKSKDKWYNADKMYRMAGKLVQQLEISASTEHMNEKERMTQESLDIKCLQLLRGLIHNQIVKLPEEWEYNVKANTKQLKKIEEVQNALNGHGAMLKVLPHLSKTRDDIVREVLAFLAAMLFGGNEQVQDSLIDYFLGTREEKFFFAVKNRMNLSSIATKEKRSLIAQHQAKVDEAIEQVKALKKAMLSGRKVEEIMVTQGTGSRLLQIGSMASMNSHRGKKKRTSNDLLKKRYGGKSPMGSRMSLQGASRAALNEPTDKNAGGLLIPTFKVDTGSKVSMNGMSNKTREDKVQLLGKDNKVAPTENPEIKVEELDEAEIEEIAASMMDGDPLLEYRDDGYIGLVLRILGLMCDGQNSTLQNYLRVQPDNIKSVNLIAETSRFLSLIYSSINHNTVELVTELFNTLVEFCSGNTSNQVVVFDNKICDYINFILRSAQFQGCTPKEIFDLKKSIATLITALIEEKPRVIKNKLGKEKTIGIAVEVTETLDAESIWQSAVDCYNKAQSDKDLISVLERAELTRDATNKRLTEMRDYVTTIGFSYFHILKRMMDVDTEGNIKMSRLKKTELDEKAWNYYEGGTLSIEILKDDELQKIYFRCRDKTILREDVKEKFKYEVDRSSPSNKLREFMDWSKDIMDDIKYTRKVVSNRVSAFFVKFWYAFNMAMISTSFIHLILVMVTWTEPVDSTGAPDFNNAVPSYNSRFNSTNVMIVSYLLAAFHNLFTVCVIISYFLTNNPTFPKCKSCRRRRKHIMEKRGQQPEEEEEEERTSNLEVKFFGFKTFWYILLLLCSVLGTVFYGYFFSFHLLHMAYFNQLVKRAIQAVSKNGRSLVMVFVYGLVILYIYGLVAFGIYRDIFNADTGHYCSDFYQCMLTVVHRGLIDGLYNFLEVPPGKPFTYYLHKSVFDLSFFIIITTIGLNIIFGIIVDTFSELRDDKWQVDNDMNTTCFICSRSSYDFEHQGTGFRHHVKEEHCQWSYLFFFIHLDETRSNDYTALEMYVSHLLEQEKYDFFPLNRALSLQHEADSTDMRLQTLMTQVTYLVDKMKTEEAAREREEERKKQVEWEKKHKQMQRTKTTLGT